MPLTVTFEPKSWLSWIMKWSINWNAKPKMCVNVYLPLDQFGSLAFSFEVFALRCVISWALSNAKVSSIQIVFFCTSLPSSSPPPSPSSFSLNPICWLWLLFTELHSVTSEDQRVWYVYGTRPPSPHVLALTSYLLAAWPSASQSSLNSWDTHAETQTLESTSHC